MAATLRPIFETCTPRDEVLHGQLSEDMFAARLRDVMNDKADPIYQDAGRFFVNTVSHGWLENAAEEPQLPAS